MIEEEVTLLPHPDSPTIPNVCPESNEKVTPSTAFTIPVAVLKCVFKLSTFNNGSLFILSPLLFFHLRV